MVGKALEMVLGAGIVALAAWVGLAIGVQALPYSLPLGNYLLAAMAAWLIFAALGGGAFFIARVVQPHGAEHGPGYGAVAGSGFGARAGATAPAVPEAPRDEYQEQWNPEATAEAGGPAAPPATPSDEYQERWNEGDERPPAPPA